ncbi:MAG: polyprenyl synthetase family protein [Candidatus Aminicenantales bacterium]
MTSETIPRRENQAVELEEIYRDIKPELEEVENCLQALTSSANPFLAEINQFLFAKKGKRIRPALVILAAKMFDYQGEDHILMASLVECIHTASLIHDDIVDNSRLRRGLLTIHTRWGPNLSVLLGDYLYIKTVNLLLESGHDLVIRLLSRTTGQMIEGEINEFLMSGNFSLEEKEYLEIIRQKTAFLFAAACEIGGLLAEAEEGHLKLLHNYGAYLGMAFQIIDDLLDFQGNESVLGKPTFSDLNEGRITLPLIHSLSGDGRPFREKIISLAQKKPLEEERKREILSILEANGSLDYCFRKAKEYTEKCFGQLEGLPASNHREALARLADYVLYRDR